MSNDALHEAAKNGDLEQCRNLLSNGAPVNALSGHVSPLLMAANHGHSAVAQFLLDYGADVNLGNDIMGITPLQVVCKKGHKNVAQVLLDHGCDTTQPSKAPGLIGTPLMEATRHESLLRLLLDRVGVDVNHALPDGSTALLRACSLGRLDSARVMIDDYKADINCSNDKNISSLFGG